MNCWLRCKCCGTRELVQQETVFGPCPQCGGGPRFAEDDNGTPMYVISSPSFVDSWDDIGVEIGQLEKVEEA